MRARIALLFAMVLAMIGCGSFPAASSPRHIARGAVLSVAYAVQTADELCAERARQIAGIPAPAAEPKPAPMSVDALGQSDAAHVAVELGARGPFVRTATADDKMGQAIALANTCERGYDSARAGLIGAGYAVDAWGEADKNEQVACGVSLGVTGLNLMVDAVQKAGVKMPPLVADAQMAAEFIGAAIQFKGCK